MRYGLEGELRGATLDQAVERVDNPALAPIVDEADQRLRRVLGAIG